MGDKNASPVAAFYMEYKFLLKTSISSPLPYLLKNDSSEHKM